MRSACESGATDGGVAVGEAHHEAVEEQVGRARVARPASSRDAASASSRSPGPVPSRPANIADEMPSR